MPRRDHRAAAAALIDLLQNTGRAAVLGRQARQRALDTFQLDRTIQRYEQKYVAAYRAVTAS